VEDIAAGVLGSNPGDLTAVGQTLFFSATSVNNSTSLWRSDGTEPGTVLVRDFGDSASVTLRFFTAVGGTLFLAVKESQFGEELWKSDGTMMGTVLVKDIQPGSTDAALRQLTAVGSTLFFAANDGVHGLELWKSDGTAAGTRLVKDLIPGSGNPDFGQLEPGPGVLLLRLNDQSSGDEPWRSDGTAEGTYRLADLVPGSGASTPRDFRFAGGNLFFVATTPSLGEELFAVSLKQVDCTAPSLTCSPTVNIEAISDQGTRLDYPPVVATDDALYGLSVRFIPSPSVTIPLRTQPSRVSASASDLAGNTVTCNFDIVVSDTTKPLLLCPEALTQEATSPTGTPASYFVVASDSVTPPNRLAMQYSPAPGSPLMPGTATVNVSATDEAGNRADCSFPLTIQDTTPPRLRCPAEVFQVARSPEQLAVNYTVVAEDAVSTPQLITSHASGDTFPLGDTVVSVQARDTAGRTSRCAFTVHLVDPEGPSITCPGPQVVQASGAQGTAVSFPEATATDNLGPPTVSYSHEPGSTFPEGVTEVTATASDVGGQLASCTFSVTVERGGGGGGSSGSSCQAGTWGGSLGWLLLVLIPAWVRRRGESRAR
jgi:ELWxxDGT repeat protein